MQDKQHVESLLVRLSLQVDREALVQDKSVIPWPLNLLQVERESHMRDERSLKAAVKGLVERNQSQAELIGTLQNTSRGLSEHATGLELKLSSLESSLRQAELTNYEDTVRIADLRQALTK